MKESVYVSMDVTRGNHLEREEKRRETSWGKRRERERERERFISKHKDTRTHERRRN
jgi:hypothetical protein